MFGIQPQSIHRTFPQAYNHTHIDIYAPNCVLERCFRSNLKCTIHALSDKFYKFYIRLFRLQLNAFQVHPRNKIELFSQFLYVCGFLYSRIRYGSLTRTNVDLFVCGGSPIHGINEQIEIWRHTYMCFFDDDDIDVVLERDIWWYGLRHFDNFFIKLDVLRKLSKIILKYER